MRRIIFVALLMQVLPCFPQSDSSITDSIVGESMIMHATFSRDIVNKYFTIGKHHSRVDSLLLDYYISHPENISYSQPDANSYKNTSLYGSMEIRNNTHLEDIDSSNVEEVLLPVVVDMKLLRPRFWSVKGDYSLQFMQNFVTGNWYKGGESNYSMLGAAAMEANFNNRQRIKWDNKLEMKLGVQNSRTDSIHRLKSTEDLLRLTSKFGIQAHKHWYYTVQMVANTQFTHSYKSNDPELYADFMSPFNLNVSLGMDYTVDWLDHRLTGTVHLAPLAFNMKSTRIIELAGRIGIDEGHHIKKDVGSQFTLDIVWDINDVIKWKSRMYGYATSHRVEYEWENTFVFTLNRWLSAQLFVFPRFDDSVTRDAHHGYFQFKEFSSIGLSYSF